MNEQEQQIEERTIVLIGTQRAGKTSLMAAWFEFLSQFSSVEMGLVAEDGLYDVARIKSVWEQIKEGVPASPTEQGLVRTNRVEFKYQLRNFAFKFVDLSGETATKSFTGELKDPEIEAEVINTCQNADQLYLVISLEDYAKQKNQSLANLLSFIDQVIKRPDFVKLSKYGLRVYLSHPEKLSEPERNQFIEEIMTRFQKARPNLSKEEFFVCSSVLEAPDGKVRFSKSDDSFSPDRMFQHEFTDLTAVNHVSASERVFTKVGKATASKKGRRSLWGAVALLCLILVGSYMFLEQRAEAAWAEQVEIYQELAAKPITEQEISNLRADLKQWSTAAAEAFPQRYTRYEYDLKVSELLSKYTSIEEVVRHSDDLKVEIQGIVNTHATNYRRLYPEILSVAEKAIANPKRWSEGAITEWREIQSFIQALQKGVYLKIARPSFITDLDDDYVLEFHIYEKEDSAPWGVDKTDSNQIKGLFFSAEDGVSQQNEQYRFAWGTSQVSSVLYRPGLDQIVVRFMEEEYMGWSFKSELDLELTKVGIHGLSMLDSERTFPSASTENWFRFNFKGYSLLDSKKKPLKVPEVLKEVYP